MSGEPNHITIRELSYWQSRKTHKSPPGPRPTLGDLQRSTPWVWMHCERCQHSAPFCLRRRRDPMGRERVERQATAMRPLHRLRQQGGGGNPF
jgi:hypothetical protein